MARYIDADDFYKRLSDPPYTIYNGEMFAEWFDECFKTQPTADVEPVRHGRWVNCVDYKKVDDVIYYGYTSCSACGKMQQYGYKTKYCPNCGAKMNKEVEE